MKLRPLYRSYLYFILLLVTLGGATTIVGRPALALEKTETTAGEKEISRLQGQFMGSSYKAKLISIQINDRTVLMPYDSETTGLDDVTEGANIVLHYRGTGARKMAVAIEPEMVEIPVGVSEIEPEELFEIIRNPPEGNGYMLIDCRPADFYAETHLPTAVSIPWTESKKQKAALLPEDKETLLIFYCLGSTCLLGPNSAALAAESGYKNVKVLLSDLSSWQDIGGQLFSSDKYIANGNIALVDLRSQSIAEAGHISGAANIPFTDLEEAEFDFPPKKSAPVVVYGDGNDAAAAIDIIKGWGFNQVSVVEGGYGGWIRRGNQIKTGPLPNSIKWQRELGAGEISIEEFNKVVTDNPADIVVVDVRTNEEAAKGKLQNSIHISLSELEMRLAEIPEDKEIILHCTTGARAKMAYSLLKQLRPKVRFLYARISCKNEKCRIRP